MVSVTQGSASSRPAWVPRFFAWGIEQVMKVYEPQVAEHKRSLFGDLYGEVLEIGPGTGPNLKYLRKDVRWTGVESNPHMRGYLEREADRVGLSVDLIDGDAMHLPYEDNSIQTVIGSLVLCSVPCPRKVLTEVYRVLKPGGEYRFIEHVAGTGLIGLSQKLIKPLWCCCADGCTINRRSWETLEQSEFGKLKIQHFRINFPFVTPHISGIATKA